MLLQRFLVTLVLLPIGLLIIFNTSIGFAIFMIVILILASLEYTGLFKHGGHQPNLVIVAASVVVFNVLHTLVGLEWDLPVLAIFVLLSMGFHLIRYELGREPGEFARMAAGIEAEQSNDPDRDVQKQVYADGIEAHVALTSAKHRRAVRRAAR